jgi:4-amino-4-deoxy-L-arabinose transferase-like glycosyltransferase
LILRRSIVLLLVLDAALLAYEAWHLGLTADEPSHFAAAQQYWLGNDVLEPSDTPPLMRILCGWIPVAMSAPVDRQSRAWAERDAYGIGAETLGRLDAARSRRILFLTRLPFLIFPLGIVWLVWRWARELWNETVGLILAACAVFEPTILGHGALIKSDVAAAFGALLFAYTAWRYWREPSPRSRWRLIASLLIAMLTKFNLLVLVPIAIVLVLVRGPRRIYALAIPAAVYLTIIAAYQFRVARIGPEELKRFGPSGVPAMFQSSNLVTGLPWPRHFVHGVLYISGAIHNGAFRGWMLGHRIEGRALGYYPLAWAIKTPIALQILLLAGIFERLRFRKRHHAELFVWGSAALYLGSAMFSNYHIGIRHVLPAIPFLILAGGFALDRWRLRWPAAVLLAWLLIASIYVFPNGISYFNEWIGGSANGWRYLVDSNVDWGQNLPDVGEWTRRNPGRPVALYVFGLDEPNHYLPRGTFLKPPVPFSPDSGLPRRFEPAPGVYAVSANMLDGIVFARGWEDYLETFRRRTPIGRAGYSIFLYEIR